MHVYPNYYKKNLLFFFIIYKNWGEESQILMKRKDHKKEFYSDDNKKIFNINDININEILVSKRLFPEIINLNEYTIGYEHNDKIKPLYKWQNI